MNMDLWPVKANEPDVNRLYFEFPVGAAGAVGTSVRQRGFLDTAPFTRTSAGLYNAFMKEGVVEIVAANVDVIAAAPTTVANGNLAIVKTRTANGANPGIVFQCVRSDTGAAADPASGDSIVGWIDVKNTNA